MIYTAYITKEIGWQNLRGDEVEDYGFDLEEIDEKSFSKLPKAIKWAKAMAKEHNAQWCIKDNKPVDYSQFDVDFW